MVSGAASHTVDVINRHCASTTSKTSCPKGPPQRHRPISNLGIGSAVRGRGRLRVREMASSPRRVEGPAQGFHPKCTTVHRRGTSVHKENVGRSYNHGRRGDRRRADRVACATHRDDSRLRVTHTAHDGVHSRATRCAPASALAHKHRSGARRDAAKDGGRDRRSSRAQARWPTAKRRASICGTQAT